MDAPEVTHAVAEPPGPEPLGPVLTLGARDHQVFIAALAIALGAHGSAAARVFRSFPYLVELTKAVRQTVHERMHAQIDIELQKPPPPPPPPPAPEKEPEPPPPPPPAHAAPPPPPEAAPSKPPAAAEAGKVLTAEPDPDEPVDLTGDGFVSGSGDRFAGGVTASTGTSKSAVRSVQASPTGTGTGVRAPAPPPAPSVDRSRPAGPGPGSWSDCGWPPDADPDDTFKTVLISVTVRPDGSARSVAVLRDPGFGFGSWARSCAMRKRYQPALDAWGRPVEQTTPPFTVKFTR